MVALEVGRWRVGWRQSGWRRRRFRQSGFRIEESVLEIEEKPDRLRIAGRGGELLFERTVDRWAHRLSSATGGELRSVEGTNEDLAPPSPAFQELLCERISPI
ncbi:MAG: hypothetical protein ACK5HA_07070, partial [Planctomycetaceae bacterium]